MYSKLISLAFDNIDSNVVVPIKNKTIFLNRCIIHQKSLTFRR